MTTELSHKTKQLVLFCSISIFALILTACNGSTKDKIATPATTPIPPVVQELEPTSITTASTNSTVYYVSTDGNNSANGSNVETAFKTIKHAVKQALPGDTVLIMPGIYNEAIILERAGSSQATITIRAESTGVILDGQKKLDMGFWCENCTGFVFENLEFRNYTDVGIGVYRSSGIVMRGLTVHHNGFAVQLTDWGFEGYGINIDESKQITIENNDVNQNGPNPQTLDFLMGTGINSFMCTDCTIRNNRSYDNVGGGILVEDGINVLVEGNEIYGNNLDATADDWWDGGIWLDGGHDVTIKDNIFRDNLGPGILISDEDHQQPYGYVLENNISTGNYYGLYIWNFGLSDFPPDDILRRAGNQINSNSRQDIWIIPWNCPPPDPCN